MNIKDVKVAAVRAMAGASLGRKLHDKDWVIMAKSEPWIKALNPTSQMTITLATQVSTQIYKDLATLEVQQAKIYMSRVIVTRQQKKARSDAKEKS